MKSAAGRSHVFAFVLSRSWQRFKGMGPSRRSRSGRAWRRADISRIERGALNATTDTLAKLGRAMGVRLAFVDYKKKRVVAA